MRKKRMGTGLSLRRIEEKLVFAALQVSGVIVIDCYGAVRIPICGDANAEDQEIDDKRERDSSREGKHCGEKRSSQPHSQRRRRKPLHWQNYRMVPRCGSSQFTEWHP